MLIVHTAGEIFVQTQNECRNEDYQLCLNGLRGRQKVQSVLRTPAISVYIFHVQSHAT